MGLSGFEKKFLASCRVGFYLRVLEEGKVGAGDVFDRVRTDPERMTVREICHLLYFDPENLEGARKALHIRALSPGWRQSFEERLAKTVVSIQSSEDGSSSPVMSACDPGELHELFRKSTNNGAATLPGLRKP